MGQERLRAKAATPLATGFARELWVPSVASAKVHKPARRQKPQMTLDRVLSRFGAASRATAAEMIRAGRVTVDGRKVSNPLLWIEPARQVVRLDGKRLKRARYVYLAMHKPKGVITSFGDPQGRPTVYDVLAAVETAGATRSEAPERGARLRTQNGRTHAANAARRKTAWLFPVGRLDQDSSGLLLLTNDSVFAERITNPATKVPKTYLVKVSALLAPEEIVRLKQGLDIGRGEQSGPARVTYVRDNGRFCWLEIEISEGKNRQVRRMIEALGHKVLKLVRTRIGKLTLGTLAAGEVRAINPADVI